ncbi:hypothetical protein ACHAWF_015051 [Thalassiosira exigua]
MPRRIMADRRSAYTSSGRQIARLFVWISAYRLANAWMIRTQFDPDEYWQTLEPAYCLAFGSSADSSGEGATTDDLVSADGGSYGCALTWEWTRRWDPSPASAASQSAESSSGNVAHSLRSLVERAKFGPVRSYVSILPTYWYYLVCRSLFRWADERGATAMESYVTAFKTYLKEIILRHASYLIAKGPALLHAVVVAAPTDLCVWLIASRLNNLQPSAPIGERQHWQSWSFWALLCSITSWFNGYALVRTYANSVETMCLTVGITCLGPELFGRSSSEVEPESMSQQRRRPRAKLAFILGGLSACVRFTSLAAWVPIGLIVALRSGHPSNSSRKEHNGTKLNGRKILHTLIGLCATHGAIGILLGCCIDRWFYGFWAIPFLGNIHFNVILGHGSLYGTHPFLWYFFAGIPAICGIMLPFFLWEVKRSIYEGSDPLWTLTWIIMPYTILHSFSEHKEFRFCLPILPLICIIAGRSMARLARSSTSQNVREGFKSPPESLAKMDLPKIRLLLTALVIFNYPHLLYLCIVHQRGPIAANGHLTSLIARAQNSRQIVHYLMGCHSAPLYSHLHVPSVRVNAWHLDCSPDCRSNPDQVCESDAFSSDPLGFVMSSYSVSGGESCLEFGKSCMDIDTVKEIPQYLVVMQDDAVLISDVLTIELNMSHVASIPHTVKYLSWHISTDWEASKKSQSHSSERDHDVITLLSVIDIHFDHMEIFQKVPRREPR